MSKQGIDGDQIQDESLTGEDVKDGSIQRKDLDILTVGQSVITKLIAGKGVVIENNTGADEGTGDVTITSGSGDFGGNFVAAFDPTSYTTTSNAWVEVFNVTIPPDTAGRALVFYTAELGQSLKSKAMGLLVEYRVNGDPWGTVVEIKDGVVKNNEFQLRSGFFMTSDLLDTDTVDVRISFGFTVDGGSASIANIGSVSWRV